MFLALNLVSVLARGQLLKVEAVARLIVKLGSVNDIGGITTPILLNVGLVAGDLGRLIILYIAINYIRLGSWWQATYKRPIHFLGHLAYKPHLN